MQNGKLYPCFMSVQAAALAVLFETDPDQRRIAPYCDIRLVKAAEHRAQDMATNAYFNHTDRDGHGPNYWIEQYGCELPDYYPNDGNSTESIALNQKDAVEVWETWRKSPGHWVHVVGVDPFYAVQRAYGAACADGWGKICVMITAPPCKE